MNTKTKRQMDKVIEKRINDIVDTIKSTPEKERGKKKLYAKLLKLIKPTIIEMLGAGYEIKMINEIINDTFGIEINYITFFRWIKRNITQKEIEKSNIKGVEKVKVSQPAPTPLAKTKPKKEIKNEKSEVKTDNTDDVLDEDMLNVINAYKQN